MDLLQERKKLNLLELKQGDVAVVNKLTGGRQMKARMDGFGIREGKRILLVKSAPFNGPLLVEDLTSGARIMIGRGMAEHVEVCPEKPS
jgi:Fe2+ transport system protein FeoA